MSRNKPNRGERSERSNLRTLGNTAFGTSFFFHPVAQIYEFTPLLSSFTHSRKYARACVCNHVRMRGVVKEGNKLRRSAHATTRRLGWPTFASWRAIGLMGQLRKFIATSGHTVACGASANVADPIGTSP